MEAPTYAAPLELTAVLNQHLQTGSLSVSHDQIIVILNGAIFNSGRHSFTAQSYLLPRDPVVSAFHQVFDQLAQRYTVNQVVSRLFCEGGGRTAALDQHQDGLSRSVLRVVLTWSGLGLDRYVEFTEGGDPQKVLKRLDTPHNSWYASTPEIMCKPPQGAKQPIWHGVPVQPALTGRHQHTDSLC